MIYVLIFVDFSALIQCTFAGRSSLMAQAMDFSGYDPLGHGLQVFGGFKEIQREEGGKEGEEHHGSHQGQQENEPDEDSTQPFPPSQPRHPRSNNQSTQRSLQDEGEVHQGSHQGRRRQENEPDEDSTQPFPPSQPLMSELCAQEDWTLLDYS